MKNYIIVIILAFLLFSCDKNSNSKLELTPNPKASFSINYSIARINDKIVVTNNSDTSNIDKFIWNFGDEAEETISSQKNLEHTFKKTGIYKIKLTAITKDGKTNRLIKEIKIGDRCIHKILIYDPKLNSYFNTQWDEDEEGENKFPDLQLQIKNNEKIVYNSKIFFNYNGKQYLPIDIPNIKFYGLPDSEILIFDIDPDSKELIFSSKNSMFSSDESEPSGNNKLGMLSNFNMSLNYYYHIE